MRNINKQKQINILAIESSCDETAASVVRNGRYALSNVINSQILHHRKYGGVVPEEASRKHIDNIGFVVQEALDKAEVTMEDIDAIGVTYGPGLVGALLVGLSFAKGLAFATNKPLIGVHHIEGHICANYLTDINYEPPFICLIVSGGHTHLVHVLDYSTFEILGKTRDDAAGEAYDKVARSLGLSYPGGIMIDNLSKEGNPNAIDFPRIMLEEDSLDFSFSGLKSSVLNYLNKANISGVEVNKANVAASFQQAVIDVLVNKSIMAVKQKGVNKLAIAGGVASNSLLRKSMNDECLKNGIQFNVPLPVYCTDNAAMIGSCAYFELIKGVKHDLDLNAYPSLKIGMRY